MRRGHSRMLRMRPTSRITGARSISSPRARFLPADDLQSSTPAEDCRENARLDPQFSARLCEFLGAALAGSADVTNVHHVGRHEHNILQRGAVHRQELLDPVIRILTLPVEIAGEENLSVALRL